MSPPPPVSAPKGDNSPASAHRFDNVNLIIAEANRQVRESMKSRLFQEGFRDIFTTDRVERVRAELPRIVPDLIIVDIDLPEDDVCRLFYDIRHHRLGDNPFLAIIATALPGGPSKARRVIDSGADDLLVKPISTEFLVERIRSLVTARKPFVVTSEYIGPDRRAAGRSGPQDRLIDVPNPLWIKASGHMDTEAMRKAIADAATHVNERKMEEDAARTAMLADSIAEAYAAQMFNEAVGRDLQDLLEFAQNLAHRMRGTRFAHVSELCQSLIQVVHALLASGARAQERDLKLLSPVARAVREAFRRGEDAARVSHDISRSVAVLSAE
jgi:DNA-binding response OmpR family regulator